MLLLFFLKNDFYRLINYFLIKFMFLSSCFVLVKTEIIIAEKKKKGEFEGKKKYENEVSHIIFAVLKQTKEKIKKNMEKIK